MSLTLGDILLHFRAQYTEVDSAFTRVERQADSFAGRIKGQLLSRFTGDTSGFEAAAQRSESMIASWSGRVKGFIRDSLTFPVGNLISNLIGGAASTVKGSVIGMNASLETTTLQFETLMKDSDLAKRHVADLFIFAKDTPFETQPIIAASRNLQVFGGNALNTKEHLRSVGDAAAAVSEDIGRVSFWYGRMNNAIKGGTAWGEAAMVLQEMGILSADVRTKMEQMKKEGASGAEVWAVFEAQMHNFDGAMKKQAGTWAGLTSTISDALQVTGAIAGKPLFNLAKSGLKAIADLLASKVVENGAKATAAGLQFLIDKATQLVAPIGQVVAILKTGDFKGGLFGLAEDSPVVRGLLRVYDVIATIGPAWQALVFGFKTGGLAGAALEVVTAIGGIEARFGPVGQAITQFDLRARQALDQVRMFVKQLWADVSPIAARLLAFSQTRIFPALMNDLAGLLPRIKENATWLLGLAETMGGRLAAAINEAAPALARLGAMLKAAGFMAKIVFLEGGGKSLGPAIRTFFTTLGQQVRANLPGLIGAGKDVAKGLLGGLLDQLPAGLRGKLLLILGAITSVFAGLSFGPALAGLFAGLAPILAPIGALLAPLGGLLLGFGKSLGGLRALLPGLGAGFRALLNPIGLLRASFGNLFTFLGVTGLKMVAVVANPLGALKLLFTGMGPALLGLKNPLGILLTLGRTILGFFSPLGILITLVGLFAGAFATDFGGIQNIVATTLGPLLPILLELGRIFQDTIAAALMGDWHGAFAILTGGFALLTPMLQQAAQTFQTGLPQIFGVLMQFLGQIGASVIGVIGQYLPGIITRLGTWATAFVAWVLPMIPPLLAAVGQMLGRLLDAVGAALPGIVEALAHIGAQFVAWVGPQIPPLLIALGGLLVALLGWIAERAPGVLAQLGAWGLKLVEWVAPQIPPLLLALGGLLGAFFAWIVEKAPDILAQLGVWATQFAVWARDEAGPRLLAALGSMFATLWTELQRLWGAAFADGSLGKSLIDGLKKGVQDGWNSFSTWFVKKLTDMIPDWARGPLGIQSAPADGGGSGSGGGKSAEPPHRATGGDVKKGVRYIVGEDGPEYFIAPADGEIEPNSVYAAITDPRQAVASAISSSPRPAAPAWVAQGLSQAAPAPAAPTIFHLGGITITITNPVVDSAERLEQLKRQLLDEATAQFTAAVNRLTLSGV